MSTHGPKLLKEASRLLLSVAAVVMTPSWVPARAGEEVQASVSLLPAAI
jgi:hypothetical protein